MKTISRVKRKWFYAILLGFCNILDGLSMILTLGHWSTNLSLKMALIGAVNAWCTLVEVEPKDRFSRFAGTSVFPKRKKELKELQ